MLEPSKNKLLNPSILNGNHLNVNGINSSYNVNNNNVIYGELVILGYDCLKTFLIMKILLIFVFLFNCLVIMAHFLLAIKVDERVNLLFSKDRNLMVLKKISRYFTLFIIKSVFESINSSILL